MRWVVIWSRSNVRERKAIFDNRNAANYFMVCLNALSVSDVKVVPEKECILETEKK